MTADQAWWQTEIIYQIYPRSFQDSNGDGIGDLPGISARLDYLKTLGVGAVWLSPIYPSPMHDFGYDVADYTAIHPIFGTMADFERLLAGAHERGLKLILDLVPNHTSNEHPWFIESRSGRASPKRDWYIWRDPAPGGNPPNNWRSFFGGPAWTLDEHSGQYYLHQFVKEQPELNYRNPAVLEAMLNNMRFWLDKGIDGFRIDVIGLMIKDEQMRDEPPNPDWDGVDPFAGLQHIFTANQPDVHSIIRAMRKVTDAYSTQGRERMIVGELLLPNADLATYYGAALDECHLPFNFQLMHIPWQARVIRRAVDAYDAILPAGAWPNWVIGNHDQHRVATRIGAQQARVANMLLLTLRGTPTTYYGEEIGMQDGEIPPEFVQDPPAVNQPQIAAIVGRDPERTPMQWDGSANAGFSRAGVRTWLPVASTSPQRNVALQDADPASMLNLYRTLAHLRRAEPSLHSGDYRSLDAGDEDIFAYVRSAPGAGDFLIVLNLAGDAHTLDLSGVAPAGEIAVATGMARRGRVGLGALHIGANEGLLLRLAAA